MTPPSPVPYGRTSDQLHDAMHMLQDFESPIRSRSSTQSFVTPLPSCRSVGSARRIKSQVRAMGLLLGVIVCSLGGRERVYRSMDAGQGVLWARLLRNNLRNNTIATAARSPLQSGCNLFLTFLDW